MAESTDKNNSKKSALDQWLSKSKKVVKDNVIKKMPYGEKAVLSHGQERLWLLDQLYPSQNLYNYAHHYQISGKVQLDLLIDSFQVLAQENEILRSNYELIDSVCTQSVKHEKMPIDLTDLSHLNSSEQEQEIQSRKDVFLNTSFDLSKDPLFLLYIFDLGNNQFEIYLVLHHIIGDAWSMGVINQQVSTIYQNKLAKKEVQTHGEQIQYKDYACWQRSQELKDSDLNYWKQNLSGELPVLDFPTQEKIKSQAFGGKSYKKILNPQLAEQALSLAKKLNTTPYVLFLATYKILLSKYCQQNDILVASPFSNRDTKELEQLIGFFNETIVLRTQLDFNLPFTAFIEQLNQNTMDALAHKNVPFDTLVNEIKIERQAGENPLFQTMFLYNKEGEKLQLGEGIAIKEEMLDLEISKFDLTLFVNESNANLEIVFEHSHKFDAELISKMSNHFELLLKQIVEKPESNISELNLLSELEYNQIVKEWNNTAIDLPKVKSIQELIFQKKHQDQVALTFNGKSITYLELDNWSSQIAVQIQQKRVGKNDFVGLYAQRSFEMIVGIMAILKSGAAYLPLDPDYPQERINFMLADTSTKIILTHPDLKNQLDSNAIEKIEIAPFRENDAYLEKKINTDFLNQYAYIIYTSGSTGNPKGVPVTHLNLIHSNVARFHFYEDPLTSFLLLSSFSFDSSITGIFWTLCCGGKIVLPPQRIEQDISALSNIIAEEQVSHSLMLPSLYQVILSLVSKENLGSLKAIMVAGEACSFKLINEHFHKLPTVKLYNEYGPTEASVWCIAHQFKQEYSSSIVPIGKPIPNAKAYILDQAMKPVPVGINGELYIGGFGVTGGYLNKPELTSEKFSESPFEKGERIYKTGDLAKYRANGLIDFLGRTDSQIKIRGHRVELEEIKTLILQNKHVEEAALILKEEGESKNIIAFLESKQESIEQNVREELKKKLPSYMIPSFFVIMDELPKLPNGKVDIKSLPSPTIMLTGSTDYVAANTEIQETLVQIWQEVLNLKQIGINDNFFDIGGDSIRSIQIIAKASQKDIQLKPTAILEYQTISQLAEVLSNSNQEDTWSSIVALKKSGNKPPLFCIHSGGAHVLFYQALAKNMVKNRPVYAIQPSGIDGEEEYHETIAEMASDYISEMQKIQSTGPYHLIGTCFGNAVGLEMMHQLKVRNEEVAIFFVVDSAPAYLEPPSPNGEKKPVGRMLMMLKERNWNGIYKKFRNRYIRFNKKRTASKRNEQEIELDEIIDSLNVLYASYRWKPIEGNIVLIRSSEFSKRKDKGFHLERWKHLSNNTVIVIEIEGHHLTLFEEPEVQGLTKVISSHLTELR